MTCLYKIEIYAWIDKHLEGCEDPTAYGKPLTADLKGYWSYRVGDYRLICEIHDNILVVLVLEIGHRSNIYK